MHTWSQETNDDSVTFTIAQINEQRQSYRDVTEHALENELLDRALSSFEKDEPRSTKQAKSVSATDSQRTLRQREEILQHIYRAHAESAFGRDLVSLALCQNDFSQARITISQPFKERIPPASVGSGLSQLEVSEAGARRDDVLVTGGLEMEILNSTINSLTVAAGRLEEQVQLDMAYWNDLTRIKENGWPIRRILSKEHTLGIHVGSVEASPNFRNKGLLSLQRALAGHVTLSSTGVQEPRHLRLRIMQKMRIVALSRSVSFKPGGRDQIDDSIRDARNCLLDEDLFHELSKEASSLWNQGVKFTENGVILPIEQDIDAIVDLATDTEMEQSQPGTADFKSRYMRLSETLLTSLRILYCHSHRERQRRRAEVPSPLSQRVGAKSASPLLLPLLSQMQHHLVSQDLSEMLHHLRNLLLKAKIDVLIQNSEHKTQVSKLNVQAKKLDGQTFVAHFLDHLTNFPTSHFVIVFQKISTQLDIMFRNQGSNLEYRYKIVKARSNSLLNTIPQQMGFQSVEELKEAILDLMRVSIADIIHCESGGKWQSVAPQTGELQRAQHSNGGTEPSIRVLISQDCLHIEHIVRAFGEQAAIPQSWTIRVDSENSVPLLDILKEVGNKSDT